MGPRISPSSTRIQLVTATIKHQKHGTYTSEEAAWVCLCICIGVLEPDKVHHSLNQSRRKDLFLSFAPPGTDKATEAMMMQMWPKCGLRSDLALEVMNDQTTETEPSLRDGVGHSFRVEGSASFFSWVRIMKHRFKGLSSSGVGQLRIFCRCAVVLSPRSCSNLFNCSMSLTRAAGEA